MKHILIPIDYSKSSLKMIQCILSIYPESGMRFYVIDGAVENDSPVGLEDGIENFDKSFSALEKALPKGQKIYRLNWKGSFIKNIQEAVYDYDIELIILGISQTEYTSKELIDRNNKDIITRIKCPVFLLPESPRCYKAEHIVLVTDYRFAHRSRATSTLSEFVKEAGAHLNILQLSKKSNSLSSDQIVHKSYLENTLELVSHSFHFVSNKRLDQALQFFINTHPVDVVILFAKHINLSKDLLFNPAISDTIDYHKEVPFLIIHE